MHTTSAQRRGSSRAGRLGRRRPRGRASSIQSTRHGATLRPSPSRASGSFCCFPRSWAASSSRNPIRSRRQRRSPGSWRPRQRPRSSVDRLRCHSHYRDRDACTFIRCCWFWSFPIRNSIHRCFTPAART